jgi:hypothetical protein
MKILVLAVALAGCAQLIEPDVGPLTRAVCRDADSDPAHDVHYSVEVNDLFTEYHCANCHTPGGKTPVGILVGGLDLSTEASLRLGGAHSGTDIVVPESPCKSVLVQKLSAGPPFGSRMPLDGPPYLEDEDITLIGDWIAEGAHDN